MRIAPVVLFVYNRLDHTQKTVESLQNNILAGKSDLYIYADAARNADAVGEVNAVREYLQTIKGFKSVTIRLRETNFGVDDNVVDGVTEVINAEGKAIVMEDDLVTSKWFLQYMNDALNCYQDQEEVISIHGYLLPIKQTFNKSFFLKGADCWGWATWKRGWDLFEPDGSILLKQLEQRKLEKEFDFNDSYPYTKALRDQAAGRTKCWDIRWYAAAFLLHKLTLHPGQSMVKNIGHDNSGTHCGDTQIYDVVLAETPLDIAVPILHDRDAYDAFADFFRTLSKEIAPRRKGWLSRSFKKLKSKFLKPSTTI